MACEPERLPCTSTCSHAGIGVTSMAAPALGQLCALAGAGPSGKGHDSLCHSLFHAPFLLQAAGTPLSVFPSGAGRWEWPSHHRMSVCGFTGFCQQHRPKTVAAGVSFLNSKRDFPSSPVVRTLSLHCRGMDSIPIWDDHKQTGTETPALLPSCTQVVYVLVFPPHSCQPLSF